MGKRCCGCFGSGSSCCGCCCSKRGATVCFSLVGLALAVAVIVPPVYVYAATEERNFQLLFPALELSKDALEHLTEKSDMAEENTDTVIVTGSGGFEKTVEKIAEDESEPSPREKYKSAILQLISDIQANAPYLAFVSFCIGCANVPIHFMLLAGATCKSPCLMLPWLAVTLLEHLIVGVPLIVFIGIIALYLAAQLHLYLLALAVMGSILLVFFLSLSSWFTVHACYAEMYRMSDYITYGGNEDQHQPLLNRPSNSGPALPPGHPSGQTFGQHQGYYPPHHQSSNGRMYPQLPNA